MSYGSKYLINNEVSGEVSKTVVPYYFMMYLLLKFHPSYGTPRMPGVVVSEFRRLWHGK